MAKALLMTDAPILVFGRNGQLARALRRCLLARGEEVRAVGSGELDLASGPEGAAGHVRDVRAVVNAAAWTAVDAAETEASKNTALNARAPGVMAEACAEAGVPFVHVSTDYVFDGTGNAPLSPDGRTDPLNAYGRAKLSGERAVAEAGGNSLVVRTSWVFDGTGKNFPNTMLRLAESRNHLSVVDDQWGRPTHAGHLAEAIFAALDVGWTGHRVEHVQGAGEPVTWAGFAREVFRQADRDVEVEGVDTEAYPTPAKRPAWSVLDCSRFERVFAHPLQPWRSGVELMLWEREQGVGI